jgi:pimeloyl-ACP methyl ester carboxylesterase
MSTFDYNGYKVWYEESGHGEPILFLHNGGNDHHIWEHQVAHFSRHYRVIVVDHIGYGRSDCPAIDYTLPLFTGEVATLIEQLGLAPVTLVGHCIGAAMALNYTLQHPGNVRRLVLFNVATEATLLAGVLADVYRNFSRDPAARDAFIQQIEAYGLPREQTDAGLQSQLGDSRVADDPDFAEYIFRLYNQKGQMRALYNNLSCFDTFRTLDEYARPGNLPPVCLFWGGANQILPRQAGEEVRARLRPDSCEFLEGCGHLAMRERPDEINRKIEAFLQPREQAAAPAR